MKKSNKLETEYQNMTNMSEEEIQNLKTELSNGIARMNPVIDGLKRGLEDAELKGQTERAEMLKEQIKGKEAEKAKLDKKLSKVEGYTKNKDAIEKIRKVKQQYLNQIDALKAEKTRNGNIMETEAEEYVKNKQYIAKINAMSNEDLAKGNAKETLDQCDKVVARQTEISEHIKKLQRRNKEIDAKLKNIETAIAKCDLAWKGLYTNKTWEEIHARSLDGRFARDKKAKTAQKEENKQEHSKSAENTTGPELSENKTGAENIVEHRNPAENTTEPELPAKQNKWKSRLQTMLNYIKHPVQSVKAVMAEHRKSAENHNQPELIETENTTEPKAIETEEIARAEASEDKTVKEDPFIAHLQKMAEAKTVTYDSTRGKTTEQVVEEYEAGTKPVFATKSHEELRKQGQEQRAAYKANRTNAPIENDEPEK